MITLADILGVRVTAANTKMPLRNMLIDKIFEPKLTILR